MESKDTLGILVEHLLRPTSSDERERALLAAICGRGVEVAAELWRDFGSDVSRTGGPHGWFATRALGPRHALPESRLALAALQGAIDDELTNDTAVIRGGAIAPTLALVIAGCSADDELAELAHALLVVFALTEAKTTDVDVLSSALAAPLPANVKLRDELGPARGAG